MADVKHCCASLYGSDAARFLLGESFHPGGVELTIELAELLHLDAAASVLDVACGKGTSAFALAERFGCRVVGIDLSEANVAESNTESAQRGLASRVQFVLGDAERLPFAAAAFEALLCECAFCTFPDKATAASEFARVVRPGGRVGLSDLTRTAAPLPELDGLLAWIACIGDARPLAAYAELLTNAGFTVTNGLARDGCLVRMVESIRNRLLVADVMIGLNKLQLPGFDIAQAKRLANAAATAVKEGTLGYALLVAERN